ncbi:hypothetical protein RJ55_07468 [Drechmeria coniospora]|nr:hypothetical protein RJ55_07468 [Drechmeria coniospora]
MVRCWGCRRQLHAGTVWLRPRTLRPPTSHWAVTSVGIPPPPNARTRSVVTFVTSPPRPVPSSRRRGRLLSLPARLRLALVGEDAGDDDAGKGGCVCGQRPCSSDDAREGSSLPKVPTAVPADTLELTAGTAASDAGSAAEDSLGASAADIDRTRDEVGWEDGPAVQVDADCSTPRLVVDACGTDEVGELGVAVVCGTDKRGDVDAVVAARDTDKVGDVGVAVVVVVCATSRGGGVAVRDERRRLVVTSSTMACDMVTIGARASISTCPTSGVLLHAPSPTRGAMVIGRASKERPAQIVSGTKKGAAKEERQGQRWLDEAGRLLPRASRQKKEAILRPENAANHGCKYDEHDRWWTLVALQLGETASRLNATP